MADCPVCLLPHDPEIHQATLRLRQWHKAQVLRKLVPWDANKILVENKKWGETKKKKRPELSTKHTVEA